MWIRKVLVSQGYGCRQIYPKSMIHVHQNKVTGTCTVSSFLVWKPASVDHYWNSAAVIRRGIRSMSSHSVSSSSSATAVQDSAGPSPIMVGGLDNSKDQDFRRRTDKSAVLRDIYGVSNTTIRDSGHGMGTTATTVAVASATSETTTTAAATATNESIVQYPPPSSSSSSSSPSPARRLRMNTNHHENNHSGHHPTATTGIDTLHLDSTLYRNNTINTRNKMAAAHLMQQQRQRQRQQQQQQGRLPSSPNLSSTSSSSNLGFTRRQQLPHQRGGVAPGGRGRESDTNTIAARVHVTSIYVARHLDVVAILSNIFGKMNVTQHRFGRTSVTVQFPPRFDDTNSTLGKEHQQPKDLEPSTTTTATTSTTTIQNNNSNYKNVEDTLLPRYVVVFRFGSCVFFNFTNREVRLLLEEIKKRSDCCIDPLPNGFEQREQFDIAISPGLEETSPFVSGDVATIKMLDLNNVAVISTVMGQTVALDSYNIYADELLATFATINTNVKRTGNFTSMERNALFKVIAQNNSLFIDMVSKLGLKDRSDTVAWNYTQYDAVYQGMRDEFLIDERFDDIEFKLNLIQQNTKFFLEVMHQNKTNLLEWIIIGLIALECGLMCLEMSGMGHLLFETLGITTAATTGTTAISDATSAATLATSISNALLDSK